MIFKIIVKGIKVKMDKLFYKWLSVVGEVESAVEVGLVRAGRVRQSVLKSAFEGRL
jgi:hypothetical protein